MKAKLVPIAFIVMAVVFVYLRFTAFRPKRAELKVGEVVITVEVADTIGKRERGLARRKLMPPDEGMYFPLGLPARHTFWMKDMRFPLDFIWIREGRVVDITENVPYPVADHPPVSVRPREPVTAVLEVNTDFTEKHGVQIGDPVALQN